MRKKEPNSLFLNYLIENESKFESQADTWIEGIQEKDHDSLEELSSSLNERHILHEACFGELGWCFPDFMKKRILLDNVMGDLRNGVSIDEIDAGVAECFFERKMEAIVILTEKHLSDSDKQKLNLAFELYLVSPARPLKTKKNQHFQPNQWYNRCKGIQGAAQKTLHLKGFNG